MSKFVSLKFLSVRKTKIKFIKGQRGTLRNSDTLELFYLEFGRWGTMKLWICYYKLWHKKYYWSLTKHYTVLLSCGAPVLTCYWRRISRRWGRRSDQPVWWWGWARSAWSGAADPRPRPCTPLNQSDRGAPQPKLSPTPASCSAQPFSSL